MGALSQGSGLRDVYFAAPTWTQAWVALKGTVLPAHVAQCVCGQGQRIVKASDYNCPKDTNTGNELFLSSAKCRALRQPPGQIISSNPSKDLILQKRNGDAEGWQVPVLRSAAGSVLPPAPSQAARLWPGLLTSLNCVFFSKK